MLGAFLAVLVLASNAGAQVPALAQHDALLIERAGLEVQLARHRLQDAVRTRDALIREAADKAKVDLSRCTPIVGHVPGWKCD